MSLASTNLRPFVPFDKKAVTRRTPREHASRLPLVSLKWKKFQTVHSGKFPSNIVFIQLSCSSDESCSSTTKKQLVLLVAGSTRVEQHQLSSRITHSNQKRQLISLKLYSRFKEFVKCVALREDKKLVCASDESGLVQVFDLQRGIQLRKLIGHRGNISSCAFSSHTYCITGGEDATLRIWNISEGNCKHVIENAHQDRISCVSSITSSDSSISFASAGVDGQIKLWVVSQAEKISERIDHSSAETQSSFTDNAKELCEEAMKFTHKCFSTYSHGEAVTAMVFFPNKSLIASAGGPDVRIWEATPNGKLVHYIRAHVKIVTCLAVSQDGAYLVTGSIDQTVKFHCCLTGNVLKSISFDDAITALHCAKGFFGEEFLCVGLNDGQWVLKEFSDFKNNTDSLKAFRNTLVETKLKQQHFFKRSGHVNVSKNDILIEPSPNIKKLTLFDKLLQSFQHQKALDYAVSQKDGSGLALIDSLIDRNALTLAVRGKTEKTILPILAFIHREFNADTQTTPILIEFTHVLLNENPWIASTQDIEIIQALQRLTSKIDIDLNSHHLFNEILGLIELIKVSSA